MFKAKILILGPCESGKTALSNFLADATDTASGEYHPTQGVRILEFENHNPSAGHGRQSAVEVEMWDCSGDKRFEPCWPAMAKDTHGIIFVYNPDQPNHDKELESWHNFFIESQGIKETSCCVFAHHKPSAPDRERTQLESSKVVSMRKWVKSFDIMDPNIKRGTAVALMLSLYRKTSLNALPDKYSSSCFSNIPVVHTNIEEDSEAVRNEFSQYLAKLTVAMSDKRDQEELSIMNHR